MLDLEYIRQNAELRLKDTTYTWIAPDRVLAMIDEIERLRCKLAECEKQAGYKPD